MKKITLLTALAFVSLLANAQLALQSGHLRLGYATEREHATVGAQARFEVADQIRFSPEALIMLPQNHTIGFDLNANAEYVFPLENGLSAYPLAGLNMANGRFSYQGYSDSYTNFGLNIGGGIDYKLNDTNYLNAEVRYTLNSSDYASFLIGYGFKF